ncbi:amidohydrolase family protein, partial [Leucobacter sp. M11]|uniref:amidohydrolase family protein n=1 Tax=Leucobacter sp. M11 TaxID=2993565 RepID=UPI002D808D30
MTESQQQAQAPAPAQTRILADWMLTQADAGLVRDAELVLGADGRIAYAGPRRGEAAPGDLVLDGQLLMPGLVNGHTHSAMTLFRGVSDDEGLAPWLDAVRARELRMTAADIATGLRLAMVEMLRSGTTAFADMYHWDEELLRIVQDAGMRVLAAPALFAPDAVGFPAADERDGAAMLDETERLAERFAGDEQIRLAYGPHAPYTCPPEFLREIGERAVRTGLPVHIHLSESAPEVQVNLDRYGRTPAMHIAELGMLDARVLVAHGVHLTQEEIELLAAGGAAISHNPVSNLKLGSGIAPLPE